MKRSIIFAAVLAVLGSANVASAAKSNPTYQFTANAASPAELSAFSAAEVRRQVGDVDLSGLTTAEVGAIEALLNSDDANSGAQIRAILADEPAVQVSR